LKPSGKINFDRRGISLWWDRRELSLSVSGEGDACAYILAREIREVTQDLVFRHA
jgi:hypothetical protein